MLLPLPKWKLLWPGASRTELSLLPLFPTLVFSKVICLILITQSLNVRFLKYYNNTGKYCRKISRKCTKFKVLCNSTSGDFYFIFFLTVSSVNTSMGMYVFSVNEACFTV